MRSTADLLGALTDPAPAPPADFTDLDLQIRYQGRADEALEAFVLPVLERSVSYDRLSTDFSAASSLVPLAQGLEALWQRRGRMRLILTVHRVPEEILTASLTSDLWVDEIISAVRKRLIAQVSTIADELARDQVAVLAWMIRDQLLRVRVAVPKGAEGIAAIRAVFQTRRYFMKDAVGNAVAATGDSGEPVLGLGAEFSDLTVYRSWDKGQEYVLKLSEEFERLWSNEHDIAAVRELDAAFADELLNALGRPHDKTPVVSGSPQLVQELLRLARTSPAFAPFNLGPAALYPHQERAFMDGLGRWPVRVLLADEVGLGKTLEAGAIIAYLIRFAGLKRVAVLAPKNTLRQWQAELKRHFDLDFWRYENASKTLVSSNDRVWPVHAHTQVFSPAAPGLVIMSAQLARGSRRHGHLMRDAIQLPDLLVVDEAHAARIKPDEDGSRHPTLLWRMLHDVSKRIPHLVMLTATPMQLHWEEFHALLALVGLPTKWSDEATYRRSLGILASPNAGSLQDANVALDLVGSSANELAWRPDGLDVDEDAVFTSALTSTGPVLGRAVNASKHWPETFDLLVRAHPGQLVAIRHSRSALEHLGYKFPTRELTAPVLEVPDEVLEFYSAVDEYLRAAYGLVERALDPKVGGNLGFARSAYHQRLVSSLAAARLTLGRRAERIGSLMAGRGLPPLPDAEDFDDDESGLGELALSRPRTSRPVDAVAAACGVELTWLKDLGQRAAALLATGITSDPKISMLLTLLDSHLASDRVLVFSRYTDTLSACVDAFLEHTRAGPIGHGKYTGSESWIDTGSGRAKADKETVRAQLASGAIRVVFCSDAAAEGLNLQSARVIINIDVPWNPARLEQRIGRIARIGQMAPSVAIYNLWYPESVEAKMYSRLIARADLYELAVGEFPDVVSQAIRNELAARFSINAAPVDDPIDVLQRLRQEDQHRALRRIWNFEVEDRPATRKFRAAILQVLMESERAAGRSPSLAGDDLSSGDLHRTVRPGDPDAISLVDPLFDGLVTTPRSTDAMDIREVVSVSIGGRPLGVGLRDAHGLRFLAPERFPDVLAAALGQRLLVPGGSDDPSVLHGSWLPDHRRKRAIFDPSAGGVVRDPPDFDGAVDTRSIGMVGVSGGD